MPFEPWHHKLPNHRVDGIYRLLPQQSELIFYKAYPHAFLSYSWHTVFCGEPVLNHPEHLEVHVRQSHSSHNRRSEEHTSELQSRFDIVCRLLLEKKKKHNK